jgi:hypothetical protein
MARENVEQIKVLPERLLSWEGKWVYLKYMTGATLSGEDVDEIVRGAPQARSGVFFLEDVSSLGIIVSRQPHTDTEDFGAFIPWGSVLTVVGPPPEEPAEDQEQAEDQNPQLAEEPGDTDVTSAPQSPPERPR